MNGPRPAHVSGGVGRTRQAIHARRALRSAQVLRERLAVVAALGALALLVVLRGSVADMLARVASFNFAQIANAAEESEHDRASETARLATIDRERTRAASALWMSDPALEATKAELRVWFRAAAAEYGVSAHTLEALHQVESNAAPSSCVANYEGSGATGPFQFKVATFGQYGIDGDRDGTRDICAFADSLHSAARYLRAIGADADPTSSVTRRALVRYGTDAKRVMTLAEAYRDREHWLAMSRPASLD